MKYLKIFAGALLAGMMIAIGGAVFLALDNKVLGALFFTVGLFTICTCGFYLYTGKICYVFDHDKSYALSLPVIWLGNLAGAVLVALLLSLTRQGPAFMEKAASMCEVKLNDSPLSIFVLAVFCDILIYVAVDGYKNNPHEAGRYLALFFGVMVFILCGFEHCVANMFYFTMGQAWSAKTFLYLLIMTAGNSVGGVLIPLIRKKIKA